MCRVRINFFLCCVKLETFGLVIGWIEILLVVALSFEVLMSSARESFKIDLIQCALSIFSLGNNKIVICIVLMMGLLVIGNICFDFVRGIEKVSKLANFQDVLIPVKFYLLLQRDSERIFNFLVFNIALSFMMMTGMLTAIGLLIFDEISKQQFLPIFTILMFCSVWEIYFTICFDSLYRKFKEESFPVIVPKTLCSNKNDQNYQTSSLK